MTNSALVIPQGLKKVPPFPPVAAKLLNLLASPRVDASEVAELVSSDPALTVRLLQYVNSSAFALNSAITNVGQAVTYLGFDQTRQITMMNAAASYAARAPHDLELQSCWRHSLATAVVADQIAKSCGGRLAKIAHTAGILHDIGRLGLIVANPRQYWRAVPKVSRSYRDLLDLEREQFGIDHAEAGSFLAESWNLPEEFRTVAGRHHDPCEGTELTLLRVTHVACRVADALGFCVVPPPADADIDAILDSLPGHVCHCMRGNREELRAHVDDQIRKVL